MKKITPIAITLVAVALIVGTMGKSMGMEARRAKAPVMSADPISHSNGTLGVLYAGSMTKTMEKNIGPAFHNAFGVSVVGQGAGSSALAELMRSGLKNPDVFISASPSVNQNLLMGDKNHNLVKWYVTVARDSLVIAYNPHGRYASEFKAANKGSLPWYQILEKSGILLGRTDPVLDPKGAYTAIMFQLASRYYGEPDLPTKIMGSLENPQQVFPEENLLANLNLGQLDAIVAYKHEAIEWGVPFVNLPSAINLGDVEESSFYAKAEVSVKGKVTKGAPIVFTATIPTSATNKTAAVDFVRYIVQGDGHTALLHDGFTAIPTYWDGNVESIPKSLIPLLKGKWKH